MGGIDNTSKCRRYLVKPGSRRLFALAVLGNTDDFKMGIVQLFIKGLPGPYIKSAASP